MLEQDKHKIKHLHTILKNKEIPLGSEFGLKDWRLILSKDITLFNQVPKDLITSDFIYCIVSDFYDYWEFKYDTEDNIQKHYELFYNFKTFLESVDTELIKINKDTMGLLYSLGMYPDYCLNKITDIGIIKSCISHNPITFNYTEDLLKFNSLELIYYHLDCLQSELFNEEKLCDAFNELTHTVINVVKYLIKTYNGKYDNKSDYNHEDIIYKLLELNKSTHILFNLNESISKEELYTFKNLFTEFTKSNGNEYKFRLMEKYYTLNEKLDIVKYLCKNNKKDKMDHIITNFKSITYKEILEADGLKEFKLLFIDNPNLLLDLHTDDMLNILYHKNDKTKEVFYIDLLKSPNYYNLNVKFDILNILFKYLQEHYLHIDLNLLIQDTLNFIQDNFALTDDFIKLLETINNKDLFIKYRVNRTDQQLREYLFCEDDINKLLTVYGIYPEIFTYEFIIELLECDCINVDDLTYFYDN